MHTAPRVTRFLIVALWAALASGSALADEAKTPTLTTCADDEDLKIEVCETDCNTYFLTCKKTKAFVVVDPAFGFGPTIEAKTAAGGKLVGFWITHEHGDHVMGLGELAPKAQVPILAHADAKKALAGVREHWEDWRGDRKEVPPPVMPTSLIADGDEVKAGDLAWKILHVPGHSRGSIAFRLGDRYLFVGDVLFQGSIGRTDLPTSDPAVFQKSLSDKLWDLPEAMVVLPGHGGRTTIGQEKKTNWLFQDFVRAGRGEAPIARPWMGIQLNPERKEKGIELVDVVAESPAAKAGLEAGDVITHFDRVELATPLDLVRVIRAHAIGNTVKMTVVRGEETKILDLTFGSRPPP